MSTGPKNMNVLAIRSDFIHHGEHSGYKQILKYTNPYKIIGVDERAEKKQSVLMNGYCWPYEFTALKYKKDIHLIHHLYADEFFRFSARLFKVPIVATFHQTPELLERDVIHGDLRGRIAKFTHKINKSRFNSLAAAIVTSPNQIEVLKKVMPEEKIHHIPLGLHIDRLNPHYEAFAKTENTKRIITVGNWQRDWDYYFQVVKDCPNYQFTLVNRKLDPKYKTMLSQTPNVTYHDDVSDEEMYQLYLESDVQFLPIIGIAASNAVMDGFALGCPLVATDLGMTEYKDHADIVTLYDKGDLNSTKRSLSLFLDKSLEEKIETRKNCRNFAQGFTWQEIARRTVELYNKVI
ncbi:MAG: glycosyltransferase involved in cell wall biosynthesis [Patiriisocius sp.]|jgi:glycosyltransferase involved in cell wall biosynthesis